MNIFLDKEQEMMYNNYINNKNKKINLGREALDNPLLIDIAIPFSGSDIAK